MTGEGWRMGAAEIEQYIIKGMYGPWNGPSSSYLYGDICSVRQGRGSGATQLVSVPVAIGWLLFSALNLAYCINPNINTCVCGRKLFWSLYMFPSEEDSLHTAEVVVPLNLNKI